MVFTSHHVVLRVADLLAHNLPSNAAVRSGSLADTLMLVQVKRTAAMHNHHRVCYYNSKHKGGWLPTKMHHVSCGCRSDEDMFLHAGKITAATHRHYSNGSTPHKRLQYSCFLELRSIYNRFGRRIRQVPT